MPSSSDRQRELMTKWFGDMDLHGPLQLLLSHGFKETRGMIYPPCESHTINDIELECIDYLFQEWDFSYARTHPAAHSE